MSAVVELGEVVSFTGGGTPDRGNPDFWNGEIPWATVKDFKTGSRLERPAESITQLGVKSSATNIIPKGTLVIPTRMALGKAAIAVLDMAINQDLKAVIPASNLDARYLLWYFIANSQKIDAMGKGATVKGITLDQLRRLKLPLPALSEQHRIAAILDKAEALRSKRREAIAKLDQLLQSVFLEMFGDPVKNPKGWPIRNLGELGDLDRGISRHRPRGAPELLGGPHPLIQTGDVARSGGYIKSYASTYSDLGLAQSKKWPQGTLCITIAANIAETGILTFDACFPDSVVGFSSNSLSAAEYVQGLFWFFKKILDEKAPQVAQKNINLEILRYFPVPSPDIELQKKWADFMRKIENQKQLLCRELSKQNALMSSLQHQFFALQDSADAGDDDFLAGVRDASPGRDFSW